MALRGIAALTEQKAVVFRPDPGSDYGTVSCSWEDKPRTQQITQVAAVKFAEGWKAKFSVEAPW